MKITPKNTKIPTNPFSNLVKLKKIEIEVNINDYPVLQTVKYLKKKVVVDNQSNELF